MLPQPTPIQPVNDTVDVAALAASIKVDVLQAAAESLVLAIEWCDDDERDIVRLNEVQRIRLLEAQLDSFQGIEQKIKDELERTIPASVHWHPGSRASHKPSS
jgi:hypothetical protein